MRGPAIATLLLLSCASCGEQEKERTATPKVMVQWIEISFRGVMYRPEASRSKEAALQLAHSLFDRARSGADFEQLKQEHSDDRSKRTGKANGPYILCNEGVQHHLRRDGIPELPWDNMSESLRSLAFELVEGEIGLCEYDPKKAPWGWHVVKRIK
ncbi:MAG: peptidylprolyl isomerase [Planctomycetota bacterium]|jgi:hypothetical protein